MLTPENVSGGEICIACRDESGPCAGCLRKRKKELDAYVPPMFSVVDPKGGVWS